MIRHNLEHSILHVLWWIFVLRIEVSSLFDRTGGRLKRGGGGEGRVSSKISRLLIVDQSIKKEDGFTSITDK